MAWGFIRVSDMRPSQQGHSQYHNYGKSATSYERVDKVRAAQENLKKEPELPGSDKELKVTVGQIHPKS